MTQDDFQAMMGFAVMSWVVLMIVMLGASTAIKDAINRLTSAIERDKEQK